MFPNFPSKVLLVIVPTRCVTEMLKVVLGVTKENLTVHHAVEDGVQMVVAQRLHHPAQYRRPPRHHPLVLLPLGWQLPQGEHLLTFFACII